ncbi:MAG: AraC family transcriptional regulator [Chthoniobacterales bacterium]
MKAILERLKPQEEKSFYYLRRAQRKFACPYHYHPQVELTWIIAGQGQRLIGDHLDKFTGGDLVLMGSQLPHAYFDAPGLEMGPRSAQFVVIQFLSDIAGDLLNTPECRSIARLLQRAGRGLIFSSRTRAAVCAQMDRLMDAKGATRIVLLLEILETLAADRTAKLLASVGFQSVLNEKQAHRIEAACAYLSTRFREPITLDEAARHVHMSAGAFSRFFHRATNRTVMQFINELRIGHVCRLLVETDQSIAQTAFAAGFENLSNFNRQFLQFRGLSPREYRRKTALPTPAP